VTGRSEALQGRSRVVPTRPDWAAPGLTRSARPLPRVTSEALDWPGQPATTARLNLLNRQYVAPGWAPPWSDLRERASLIRRETLGDLEGYLARLSERVEANGGVVHRAASPPEALRTIEEIATANGVELVVKSKSMATEEIHLNHHLEAMGIDVVETDLGEYILQLADERPSHIVAPAVHRSKEDIAALFEQVAGGPVGHQPEALAAFARQRLRQDFHRADMGITGVNFAAADTGTLALVTNEGNGRMVTSQPRIHVAVMTVEKVVPRFADLAVLLPLVAWAATRVPLSVYQTLVNGPRRPGEQDGPEQLHLVILDNGRTRLLGGRYQDVLACIRCGACQFSCPVYRTVGGHAYSSVYGGPIGAVLTPLIGDPKEGAELPFLSSLCGACADACPVKIPLPDMLVDLRADYEARRPDPARLGWAAWGRAWAWGAGFRASSRATRRLWSLLPPSARAALPGPGRGWGAGRSMPPLERAGELREWVRTRIPSPRPARPGSPPARPAGDGVGSPSTYGSEPASSPDPEQAAHQMCLALERVRARGHVCSSAEQARRRVADLCGGRPAAIESHPDLAGMAELLSVVDDPWKADVGVTGVELAVAETGTLALVAGPGRDRSTSLVPPEHVALVPFSRLVPSVAGAVERLAGLEPWPSCISFVTGISRSSDIEHQPVYGVHGPGKVDVVLYPG
jgi:L-lactate dehydrogenase complex protein LldF